MLQISYDDYTEGEAEKSL